MHGSADRAKVFVFGSNLAGRHGKGAAKFALHNKGAVYGIGVGHVGMSYAIPTKDEELRVLALSSIRSFVEDFLKYARERQDLTFELTPIGCGLAGYNPMQIAPMFNDAPNNVILPEEFKWSLNQMKAIEVYRTA